MSYRNQFYRSPPGPEDNSTQCCVLPLIASPLLLSCKPHQRGDRPTLVLMAFDEGLATCANSSPLANKTSPPEEVTLNAQAVVPPHVAGQIDTTQIKRRREDFKLTN